MPVQLGCCPEPQRCLLCPPPPDASPELVEALVDAYASSTDGALQVRFFGGPPPSDDSLAAAGDHDLWVRVRPDLLTRAEAARLVDRGVRTLELDALSFDARVLQAVGRRYAGARLDEMAEGLTAHGVRVGGVLAPGLPGSDFASAVADAHRAAASWSFARLHPVLVLDGSGLRELHARGRYEPLGLGAAITVCRAQLDILEDAGVVVTRIGLQPGPDGFGRAVAGPHDPGFRELVEARRTLDVLRRLLAGVARGASVTIGCSPADETRTRGMYNQNVRTLRAEAGLTALRVQAEPALARGQIAIHVHEEIS